MKQDKLITVKEFILKNNCPECYSNTGMKLTFKQRFIETSFYKRITNDITHTISCNTCHSTIYPVQWDEHIERVFEYQQKAFVPKKASRRFKKSAWILFSIASILLIAVVSLIIYKVYL